MNGRYKRAEEFFPRRDFEVNELNGGALRRRGSGGVLHSSRFW
jgi:hypothetical protein